MFNVFAFYQCHQFHLLPIAMPMSHWLSSYLVVPLLFALLLPMPPLLTPLPPITDIVPLFAVGINEELCISILEEVLQHFEKLLKT